MHFYSDSKGRNLTLEWLQSIPGPARIRGLNRLDMLQDQGNQLRRPYADFLRDGIYELRWESQNVQYRILFFYKGRQAIVVSHGFTKHNRVPDREIDLAIQRKIEVESKGV